MKYLFTILFLFCVFLLPSCIRFIEDDDEVAIPEMTKDYAAVKYARADLDSSIQLLAAQEIVNSGKIYVINDLLFVGEKRKGFHVFDNSDPRSPVKVKFIQALGSTDLAVRNNILYVNQATDLLALQYVYEEDRLTLLKRIENTFPKLLSPQGYYANTHQDSNTVDWEKIN